MLLSRSREPYVAGRFDKPSAQSEIFRFYRQIYDFTSAHQTYNVRDNFKFLSPLISKGYIQVEKIFKT